MSDSEKIIANICVYTKRFDAGNLLFPAVDYFLILCIACSLSSTSYYLSKLKWMSHNGLARIFLSFF